jgi:hypothetical protein
MLKVSGYYSLPHKALVAADNKVRFVAKDSELSIIEMSAAVK